jgi:hypothetical protein
MTTQLEHMSDAELREHWGNLASNFLVGKTIRRVRYLNNQEIEDLGWTRSNVVVEFTDGHWIVPMMDDEGNDSGVLWTSSGSELNIIPSI